MSQNMNSNKFWWATSIVYGVLFGLVTALLSQSTIAGFVVAGVVFVGIWVVAGLCEASGQDLRMHDGEGE